MSSRDRNKKHNSPIHIVQTLNNRLTQNNQCLYIKHMGVIFCDVWIPFNYPTHYLIIFSNPFVNCRKNLKNDIRIVKYKANLSFYQVK